MVPISEGVRTVTALKFKAPDDFVLAAIHYAERRWAFDDPVFVIEWCNARHGDYSTAAACIDALAEKYNLIDFKR